MKRIRLLLLTALAVLALCAAASAEEPSVTRYGESAAATASAPGGADNDELFYQYMLRQGRGDADEDLTGGSTGEHLARAGLNEDAQKVYDLLAENIKKIAAGKSDSSEISISLSDLGFKINRTPEVVNVEGINRQLYPLTMEDGSPVTQDAKDSLENVTRVGVNEITEISGALLLDMPYELYWYNKTNGGGVFAASVPYIVYGDFQWVDATEVTVLSYKFSVSENYLKTGAENNFQINTTLAKATDVVATNAKNIVAANSAKSDYAKVKAYKEEICKLVAYNQSAVDNENTAYGNPWQLIWVFDHTEESTAKQVVCEGYAKAFQYLCDLTNFTSNQIQCYTVTGTMNGGTGAGNHMWNVVTMDDGKNYLVDVTNCDGDSVGAPEFLFLKGVTEDTDGYHVTIAEWREDLNDTQYIIHNAATVYYSYDDATKNTWAENILRPSIADYSPLDAATVDRVTLSLTGTAVKVGDVGVKGCVYLLGEYDGNGRLTRLQTVWNGTSKTVNEALNWSGSVESGRTVKLFLLDGTTFAPMKAALSQSAS